MKSLALVLTIFPAIAFAQVKFNFTNEELPKIITAYSAATGQKFVIDPAVRGQASITGADNVSKEEAFNLLSSTLAVNGLAISKQGDTMVVQAARNVQRSLIEVSSELPALKPERMATYVYNLKHLKADVVNREIRIFPSKDGEMNTAGPKQIIFVDWTSNLHRIDQLMKQVDVAGAKPQPPKRN